MKIPKVLHEAVNTAFPQNVCLIGTQLPNGHTQITPRGSAMVYDDEHIALWERGKGSTTAGFHDGSKATLYLRRPDLRESGVLPLGGIARFYGAVSAIHKSGPVYDEVWRRLNEVEKSRDAQKKGFAVLIEVDSVEDLNSQPLKLD